MSAHVAGFALGAFRFGVRFERVAAPEFDEWRAQMKAGHFGGVELEDGWSNDHLNSLRYTLSGSVAETVLMGHPLEDSAGPDLGVWLEAVGIREGSTAKDRIRDFTGVSLEDAMNNVREYVEFNRRPLMVVANALRAASPAWMSYDAVIDIYNDTAAP